MVNRRMWRAGGLSGPATWGLLACLALSGAGGAGCGMMKALAYFAQPTSEKIAAEYNRLPGKTVVIYVWAPPEILWDYTKLRLDLSAYLGAYLQKHVKDVQVVDALRVEAFIEKKNAFELDPVELGKEFKADAVVHLSVFQFSVREPGMAHFYRGRIGSSVAVHDLTATAGPERVTLKDVKVVVPESGPVGLDNTTAAQIRQEAYDAFTVEVGKKFHEFERQLD